MPEQIPLAANRAHALPVGAASLTADQALHDRQSDTYHGQPWRSVQVAAPVAGTRPAGPGAGWSSGWCSGGGQRRAARRYCSVAVVPEPALARLEAADHRVPGGLRVRGRVLGRRGVAAADVPALRAAAQVEPPAAGRLALDAAGAARRRRSGRCRAARSCRSSWRRRIRSGATSGSRTLERVSPGSRLDRRSPWCLLTTIRQEMSRPSPVPSPTGLVVKNGSKIRVADLLRARPGRCRRSRPGRRSSSRAVRTVSVPGRRPSRRPRCRSGWSRPG